MNVCNIYGNDWVKPHLFFLLMMLTQQEAVETFVLITCDPLCEKRGTFFFSHGIFRVVWSKGIVES